MTWRRRPEHDDGDANDNLAHAAAAYPQLDCATPPPSIRPADRLGVAGRAAARRSRPGRSSRRAILPSFHFPSSRVISISNPTICPRSLSITSARQRRRRPIRRRPPARTYDTSALKVRRSAASSIIVAASRARARRRSSTSARSPDSCTTAARRTRAAPEKSPAPAPPPPAPPLLVLPREVRLQRPRTARVARQQQHRHMARDDLATRCRHRRRS